MRQLLWLCSIVSFSVVQSSWKIGTITKPVDLTIESAWYLKGGKPKQITGLTSKLVSQKAQSVINVHHRVGDKTGECAYMIARSQSGKRYKIVYDGPSVYAVYSGRTKTKGGSRAGVGKKQVDVHKYDYMARVFLYELDTSEYENPLTYAVKGFILDHSDVITLDIEISDTYNIMLKEL